VSVDHTGVANFKPARVDEVEHETIIGSVRLKACDPVWASVLSLEGESGIKATL
jgi:hypothetical protein